VNNFQGTRLRRHEHLTQFLFVDDVLIFCFCAATKGGILKDILELFCDATSMVINVNKSSIFQIKSNPHFPQRNSTKQKLSNQIPIFHKFEI
jgi:hypothetical protein